MLAAMSDWNVMTVVIVVCLFALWKLELVATLLNLKAFPESVPAAMEGWLSPEKLDQARDYLRVNARFGIVRGAFSLTTLLVFWALGGFGWLDGLSRSWAPDELVAGLVFISLLVLGQGLLDLPFDYHDTFVIEEAFGFNRATLATFVMDRVKGLLLGALLGLPLLAAVLWIFANVPHA
jgi:STE24 endopeptidase